MRGQCAHPISRWQGQCSRSCRSFIFICWHLLDKGCHSYTIPRSTSYPFQWVWWLMFNCKHTFEGVLSVLELFWDPSIDALDIYMWIAYFSDDFSNKSSHRHSSSGLWCIYECLLTMRNYEVYTMQSLWSELVPTENYVHSLWLLFSHWDMNLTWWSTVVFNCSKSMFYVQASAVKMWSSITWYHTYHYRDWGRMSITSWIHKIHPIARPFGWAMKYLLWIFCRNLSLL